VEEDVDWFCVFDGVGDGILRSGDYIYTILLLIGGVLRVY
jgi:hypothetical protein